MRRSKRPARGAGRKSGATRTRAALSPRAFARALARRGLIRVPRKVLFSVRLDQDVLEWFRRQGPGYQSRINALLRAYMEVHL